MSIPHLSPASPPHAPHLRGFAAPRLSRHQHHLVAVQGGDDLLAVGSNGQRLPASYQALHLRPLDALLPQRLPPSHLGLIKRRGMLGAAPAAAPATLAAAARLLAPLPLLLACSGWLGGASAASASAGLAALAASPILPILLLLAAACLPGAVRILQVHVMALAGDGCQLSIRGRVGLQG